MDPISIIGPSKL